MPGAVVNGIPCEKEAIDTPVNRSLACLLQSLRYSDSSFFPITSNEAPNLEQQPKPDYQSVCTDVQVCRPEKGVPFAKALI